MRDIPIVLRVVIPFKQFPNFQPSFVDRFSGAYGSLWCDMMLHRTISVAKSRPVQCCVTYSSGMSNRQS